MSVNDKIERVLIAGLTATEALAKGTYVLLAKELFIETDTYKMKLGDGVTAYNRLSYMPFSQITKSNIANWNQAVIDSRNNILPSQVGHTGEFLTTNGSTLSWSPVAGGGVTSVNGLVAPVQTFSKVDDTNVTLNITSAIANHAFTLGWTGTLADGRIASAATWNAKQNAITTGTTLQYFRGDLSLATFPTNVSSFTNDAGYLTSLAGAVLTSRTLTINGVTFDLSANRTWTVGDVTASSITTFTNKSGNISQWTNDSGYLTSSTIPLTANRIAFGSATNFMTSNANFTYNLISAFSVSVTSGTDVISQNLNGGGAEIGYFTTANTYAFVLNAATHSILGFSNLTTIINTGFHAADRVVTMGITNLAGNNTMFEVDDSAQTYKFNKLAGGGTLMATIDNSGILGTTAIPTNYISSVANTATVNLSVSGGGQLTAAFASMNISQFTNNSGYLTSTGITPAALTKTDDTNVTLTLGGTPATALLQATSITVGWTGTLADSRLSTTAVSAGSYGSATQVGTFTVSATGRLTAASNVTITPAASSITGGAALTKTDDTNVTLTLGGTPASALLAAASLTLGWTGTLAISRGGTGASTDLTARANLGTFDAVLTSDYTNATQTASNLSLGTFTIAASETWSFEVYGVGQVSGASGVRFKVTYSNAPVTASQIQTQAITAGTLTSQTDSVTIATTPAETSTVWAAATTELPFSIKGCVVNSASSCTINITCRCIGAGQTVTIRRGTYITARKIS